MKLFIFFLFFTVSAQEWNLQTGNTQLQQFINAALKRMIQNGEWDKINQRWLGQEDHHLFWDCGLTQQFDFPLADEAVGSFKRVLETRVLRFGGTMDMPLFLELVRGVPQGFEVDIAKALVFEFSNQYLSANDIVVSGPIQSTWTKIMEDGDFFGDLAYALTNSNPSIDIIMSSVTKTHVRSETVGFSCSYYSQRKAVIRSTKDLFFHYPDESNLNHRSTVIGVDKGTTHVDFITDQYPLAHMVTYETFEDKLDALCFNEVHVIIVDEIVAQTYISPDDCPSKVLNFTVGATEYLGMGFRIDHLNYEESVIYSNQPTETIPNITFKVAKPDTPMCTIISHQTGSTDLPCYKTCPKQSNRCLFQNECRWNPTCPIFPTVTGDCCENYYTCCSRTCDKNGCKCSESTYDYKCKITCPKSYEPELRLSLEDTIYTQSYDCGTSHSCVLDLFEQFQLRYKYPCFQDGNVLTLQVQFIPNFNGVADIGPLSMTALIPILLSLAQMI